jgi:hypothetical protein
LQGFGSLESVGALQRPIDALCGGLRLADRRIVRPVLGMLAPVGVRHFKAERERLRYLADLADAELALVVVSPSLIALDPANHLLVGRPPGGPQVGGGAPVVLSALGRGGSVSEAKPGAEGLDDVIGIPPPSAAAVFAQRPAAVKLFEIPSKSS